jgi:hypothetical protein
MQGSKYAPGNSSEYSAKDLNADFKGMKFTASAGTTTTNDLQINDDVLVDGAVFHAIAGEFGDKAKFQIIDKDNVMGFGANVVLAQFVTDWYINPDISTQLNERSPYPAKIYSGLYVRVVYDSVGSTDVKCILNLRLHKVLW